MSQAAPAWWEDVEHLREAAERRIAERERAQREGREPVALPPLRPLSDTERETPAEEPDTATPRPLTAAPKVRTGRFRRHSAATTSAALTHGTRSGTIASAGALALDVELAPAPWPLAAEPEPEYEHEPEPRPWEPDAAPADERRAEPTADRHALRREHDTGEQAERPSRRDELSRLARDQTRAATASRPRTAEHATVTRAAESPVAGRRTIEIRGQAVARPVIAAVPDPVDAPRRRTRPRRTAADHFVANPDRIALWAFLLGLFLVIVATISAHS